MRKEISGAVLPGRVGPGKPFPRFLKSEINQSVAERFEQQVAKHADRLAVKTATAHLTYDGLNQAANRIARAIIKLRGTDNEPVALFLDQGAQLIPAILGALKAGKPYIALDTSFTLSKNISIIKHCQPGLVITGRGHYSLASKLVDNASQLLEIEAVSRFSPENLKLRVAPETAAYIIYTSGSTGEPKGVSHDHRNVLHNVMRCSNMLHLAPDDRLSLLWSCSFAASVPNVFGALLNGAALFPFDIKKEGIAGLAGWLEKEEITIYHSVPTVYRHFVSTLSGKEMFPRLRMIKLSGEPVLKRDVESYSRHFHRGCIFHVSYASTETNIVRQFFCDHDTRFSGGIVPAGYEVEDMEVFVLDEKGKRAAPNAPGEIVVSSPYLPRAYYRKDGDAGSPFKPDEQKPGHRVFRTGDIGYMQPDGCLVHLGRKDHQLKIRGYRVETGEIETVLNGIGGIKETAVAGFDDGQGGKFLAAYVVARKGEQLKASHLRNFLLKKLPDYMVPSRFVFLDALPLTLSGKVDRKSLPIPGNTSQEENYIAPGAPDELMLASVWRNLFGIERIGAHDNFFDLGGHSLLAARMSAEIKKLTGKIVPVSSLIQAPTIRQLAMAMQAEVRVSKTPSIVAQAGGHKLPLFWIGINAFLPRHIGQGQPLYGMLLPGDYGRPAVFRSLEELAGLCLKDMLAIQPNGPYMLGGWCFWGLVAMEMAQQLLKRGHEVPLLCMIDPPPQCVPVNSNDNGVSPLRKSLLARINITCADSQGSVKRTPVSGRIRQSPAIGMVKTAICHTSLSLGRPVPKRFLDFYRINTAKHYKARPYPGKAVIFIADKRCVHLPDYSGLAAGGTHIHEIRGASHLKIMEEPFVGTWGRQLAGYLEEINGLMEPNTSAGAMVWA